MSSRTVASHRRRWPGQRYYCAFLLLMCVVTVAAVSHAGYKFSTEPLSPADYLYQSPCFVMANLHDAASQLRANAQSLGIDIHAVPQWSYTGVISEPAPGTMRVAVGLARATTIDAADDTFVRRMQDEGPLKATEVKYVALFVSETGLTIDQVATVLEDSVQIMRWCGPRALVVRGDAAALSALSSRVFFGWLKEITPDMRRGSYWHEWPAWAIYEVNSFVPLGDEQLADLTRIGVTVDFFERDSPHAGVKGSWEQINRLLDLWWISAVLPPPPVSADELGNVPTSE